MIRRLFYIHVRIQAEPYRLTHAWIPRWKRKAYARGGWFPGPCDGRESCG